MKFIIKEYLSELKESRELDAIIPELLLAMGINVFITPQLGVKQGGVDIAAIGKLPKESTDKVLLFVIKEKDITRCDWAKDGPQEIRPSLQDVLDDYIPTRLPKEYKKLPIQIIVCCGGVFEQNLTAWNGFRSANSKRNISFDEWNGYKLAGYMNDFLFNENILNDIQRQYLRKTLALVAQPEEAINYAFKLIDEICNTTITSLPLKRKALCTLNLVIRIIHSWARKDNNLECSFLSVEHAMLKAWDLIKMNEMLHQNNFSKLYLSYFKLLDSWGLISDEYYLKISPAFNVEHSLSRYSRSIAENTLKVFDICGKLSTIGLWNLHWYFFTRDERFATRADEIANGLCRFLANNPASSTPAMDSHAIDIILALNFLYRYKKYHKYISDWLDMIVKKSFCGYRMGSIFPMCVSSNETIIDVIFKSRTDKEKLTVATTLYPQLAAWAAVLKNAGIYQQIREEQNSSFKHSNFQIMYPDAYTENFMFKETGTSNDGATFSGIKLDEKMETYIKKLIEAGKKNFDSREISCIKKGFPVLSLMSSRHFRRPVIPQTWLCFSEFWNNEAPKPS